MAKELEHVLSVEWLVRSNIFGERVVATGKQVDLHLLTKLVIAGIFETEN